MTDFLIKQPRIFDPIDAIAFGNGNYFGIASVAAWPNYDIRMTARDGENFSGLGDGSGDISWSNASGNGFLPPVRIPGKFFTLASDGVGTPFIVTLDDSFNLNGRSSAGLPDIPKAKYFGVGYNGSVLCAVGEVTDDGPAYFASATSTDGGVTWTRTALSFSPGNGKQLFTGPGVFIISTGYNNTTLIYSKDGVTWIERTALPEMQFDSYDQFLYGGGRLVGVTRRWSVVSDDYGVTWDKVGYSGENLHDETTPAGRLVFDGRNYVQIRRTLYGGKNVIAVSPDGRAWSEHELPKPAANQGWDWLNLSAANHFTFVSSAPSAPSLLKVDTGGELQADPDFVFGSAPPVDPPVDPPPVVTGPHKLIKNFVSRYIIDVPPTPPYVPPPVQTPAQTTAAKLAPKIAPWVPASNAPTPILPSVYISGGTPAKTSATGHYVLGLDNTGAYRLQWVPDLPGTTRKDGLFA